MRRVVLVGCFMLAGCGGGGTSAPPAAAPAPVPAFTPGGVASLTISLAIPPKKATSRDRHASYVSPSTQSVAVQINGGAIQTFNAVGPTITVTVNGVPQGPDTVLITAYDGLNGTGNALSTATATPTIVAGANNLPVTLLGIPKSLSVSLSNPAPPVGAPAAITATVTAFDAGLNVISGTYASPVLLTSGDVTNAPITANASIPNDVTTATVSYNGNCSAATTIAATNTTATPTSASLGVNRYAIASTADNVATPPVGSLRFYMTNNKGSIYVATSTMTTTLAGGLTVGVGQADTICATAGNTYTIDGAGAYSILNVSTSTSSLALSNVTLQNGSSTIANGGGAITVATGATASLVNCTVKNNANSAGGAGGIYLAVAAGSLTVSNSSFIANTSPAAGSGGAAIWNNGASNWSVSNSAFTNNSASSSSSGGAILNGAGNFTCTFCTFTTNSAGQGGAVALTGGATTLTTPQFTGNSATLNSGGALYIAGATATQSTGSYTTNSAPTFAAGGAIEVGAGATFTDSSSSYLGNTSGASGGVLDIVSGGSYTSTNVTMGSLASPNSALTTGGAISSAGTLSLTTTNILYNGVTGSGGMGGGIYLSGGTATLNRVNISNNTFATNGKGGALALVGGTATLTNSTMAGNGSAGAANGQGGGIWIGPSGTVNVRLSTLVGNLSAVKGGNALLTAGSGALSFGGSLVDQGVSAAAPDISNLGGLLTSLGYNGIGDAAGLPSGFSAAVFTGPGDLVNQGVIALTAVPASPPQLYRPSLSWNTIPSATCLGWSNQDASGTVRPGTGGMCTVGAVQL